jgi:hypothetical protein
MTPSLTNSVGVRSGVIPVPRYGSERRKRQTLLTMP